ncbi:MAG: phage terminase large subunit [Candidatus Sumerlaeaceae bacterium]
MHRESLARYDALTAGQAWPSRKGKRLVLVAPRGHAKSAIHSTLLPLLDLCFGRERFIVLISATMTQAIGRLRAIRHELLTNELLRTLFPHAARSSECSARTLVAGATRISAFGAGCELRGIGHCATRPTKIILDDVEESDRVHCAAYRDALAAWYREVIEPLGEPATHIEVVGTLLHCQGLLAQLARMPHFDVRVYRAVEQWATETTLWQQWREIVTDPEHGDRLARGRKFFHAHEETMLAGTRVLWPEKESYLELVEQLVAMGRPAFYKEKQNLPPPGEGTFFVPEEWHHFTLGLDGMIRQDPPARTASLGISSSTHRATVRNKEKSALAAQQPSKTFDWEQVKSGAFSEELQAAHHRAQNFGNIGAAPPARFSLSDLIIVGFLDPSLGKGDWAAIATVGKSPATAVLYVLDLWLGRVPPAAQLQRIRELHRRWHYHTFGYEAVGFQRILEEAFVAQNAHTCEVDHSQPKLLAVSAVAPKATRIASLEPLVSAGWIRFARGLPEELYEEARTFPHGKHDDALDALAGAVALARQIHSKQTVRTIAPRRDRPRRL